MTSADNVGIVDQLRQAKNEEEIDILLSQARGYDMISKRTLRKCERVAIKTRKSFETKKQAKKKEAKND
tara:strand:+ start:600 stop:806 length:207 start_codon:yes stop_codon:yes gene_type:complete